MSEELLNVSDITTQKFSGEYVSMRELVDHELRITAVTPITTKFGEAVAVEVTDMESGEEKYFITSAVVVMRKLLACLDANALPLKGMVVRVAGKRYFDIL